MEIYNPFAIVVVPFPFTDAHQTKKRPALVISSKKHQQATGHVTLLMITSAKHSHWESDYEIKDLAATGLNSPSLIRQKIFTLDSRLIIKQAGKLSASDQRRVITQLKAHICFNSNNP